MNSNDKILDRFDNSFNLYNSQQNEQDIQEIKPFNCLNTVKIIFSKNENIFLLYSIGKCWFKVQAMMLESWLYSDPDLMQKAQIKLAKGIGHRFYELLKIFGEITYGEGNVLVTTRNIGTKEVLRNQEDRKAYIELRNLISKKIKENDLVSFIGYDNSYLNEEFKNNIENFEPKSAKRNGVCFSACMYLLGKLINEPYINEEVLVRHVDELHEGVPANVAAIQQIYHDLKFIDGQSEQIIIGETNEKIRTNFCNDIVSIIYKRSISQGFNLSNYQLNDIKIVVSNAINALEKNGEDIKYTIEKSMVLKSLCKATIPSWATSFISINEAAYRNVDPVLKCTMEAALNGMCTSYPIKYKNKVIAHLYGFKVDSYGTVEARNCLGPNKNYSSSKEHLQNMMLLEPGFYEISFFTMSTAHSVLYLKTQQRYGYLIDPNYGLIKCDPQDHKLTILKMLSLYPPPDNKKDNENDNRNYGLFFTKYMKPLDLNTLKTEDAIFTSS